MRTIKIVLASFIFFAGFTVWPGAVFTQETGLEMQIIQKLDVEIIHGSASPRISPQAIKARLKTKEGDVFSQTGFDSDLKMFALEYDRVEPQLQLVDGGIVITLKIWQRPLIKDILFLGNDKVATKRLHSELGIAAGAIFDRQAFAQAFNKVKEYYVKQGFFEAELDYRLEYSDSDGEVTIIVEIQEGRAGKISKIVFTGFDRCEESELLEIMATKPYNFFFSWLTGQGTYNEDMILHDKFVILNYLQNKGFADASVDLDVCEAKENNRIILHITANKGVVYHFGTISIEGNTLFTTEKLLSCIKARPDQPFSPEAIQKSIEILTNCYGCLGYIEAVIHYEPKLSEHACIYDLNITIEEGEQFRVGMIKVLGNCITQTKVILHETLLIPGEVFNLEKLKATEARLCNIGFFKNVNVYAVKSDANSLLPGNYRDVHIEVEETSTGHVGAFFGFSTVESMFGGVNLTERNFNIRGLSHFWQDGLSALRGGGEYAHITATLGNKTSSYVLSWTKPYFNDTKWSIGFDLEKGYNKYIADDYEIFSYGMTLHAAYVCNPYVKIGTHYRLKYSDIRIDDDCRDTDGCDVKEEAAVKDQGPHEGKCDKECGACKQLKKQAKNDGLISALGATWLYDSTDRPLKPTSGVKSRLDGEIAGLGGHRSFFSVAYLNSLYYNLWGTGVLKFRADLRFIQPLGSTGPDDIPVDERFFLGGDYEVRGYRSYRLGPKFCHEDDNPRGGISMQLFSIEYCKPVLSCADLFLFYDAGSLSMEKWAFGRLNQSVGFGARVKIFEGMPPLTLGMGYPLNPKYSSDVKRFFISVGGKF